MEIWPFVGANFLQSMKINEKVTNSTEDINEEEIKVLSKWFTSTPAYTTYRVNTSLTLVENCIKLIQDQLLKQYDNSFHNGFPSIEKDNMVNDCVVIGQWKTKPKCLDKQEKEVIVDVPCGAAVLRGAHVYVPGVLAMSSGIKEGMLISVYADLSRKCLKGFIKKYDDSRRLFIGNGIARVTRKELFEGLKQVSGIAVEMKFTTSGVPSFLLPPSLGILQNYPSVLCSHVLNPQPGENILDMCASPGNKTTHIACLMNGEGNIVALDKTERKVTKLKESCRVQQLNNVFTFVCDATSAVSSEENTERHCDLGPPFQKESFDRILLDPPCSALGQRPQFATQVSVKQMNSHPILQKKLMTAAVDLLKPGGILVYSTCTLLVPENEGIVSWALKKFIELELVPANPIIGSPGVSECGLTEEERNFVQNFGPYHLSSIPHHQDTLGFFIAKFKKKNR